MKIVFNDDAYEKRPGVLPKSNLELEIIDKFRAERILNDYIAEAWKSITRPPLNNLKYPYVIPGATYNELWDWDAFFMSCAIPESGLEYAKGSILNLLDSPLQDGRPSKKATSDGEYDYYLHPYPLRAQFAYIIGKRSGNFEWLASYWDKLLRIMRWYENSTRDEEGLFRWLTLTGIDNNPSIYGRQSGTVAGVDLATFHYREYLAMDKLSVIFNFDVAGEFREKAYNLKELIQNRYWDIIDGMFYDIDRNIDYKVSGRQKITWDTHLKFRNWSCLYPLWGGIATPQQANIIRDKIMDENEFLAPCGIRSHSRKDPIYNNELSGSPSNWQGPVWGLTSCLVAYGLADYNYKDDALEVASRFIQTCARDITQNGCMHEYYHGDSGQPVIKPGFLGWNILAGKLIEDLHCGSNCTNI